MGRILVAIETERDKADEFRSSEAVIDAIRQAVPTVIDVGGSRYTVVSIERVAVGGGFS